MSRNATPGKPRGRLLLPLTILVLGVASLFLLLGIDRIHERLIHRDVVRSRAIAKVQVSLATAHLWLEEQVSGDLVDTEEIAFHLQNAVDLIDAVQGVVVAREDVRGIVPFTDDAMLAAAAKLRTKAAEFHRISSQRQQGYHEGGAVGIGSKLDQTYDAVFGELLVGARDLERQLDARQIVNRKRAAILFRTICIAWGAIVIFAVIGLWTREHRRVEAEQILQQREEQLLQSQKMEAVGRLAGGMAHDINNYLGAIQAQSELARMKAGADESLVRKMDSIVRTVHKASALIERLLAFSRQQPIVPTTIDLNRVVEDGLGMFVQRLVGEQVRLRTELDPALWTVKIDPSQLEQIVMNLIVNARDAMPDGGEVTVTTSNQVASAGDAQSIPQLDDGEYVVLAVSDSGVGMTAEVRGKIFEPFFTTKQASGNSGIGLATVYAIVEQYGGAVHVSSHLGRGSTFRIYLPRSMEIAGPVASIGGLETAGLGGTERILLVEDNDELRDSTRTVIETLGYRVDVASSGEQALEIYERVGSKIDLIVTDVVMGGMSGRELAERLRRRGSRAKVLFVSGYTDDVVLQHGIETGRAEFLKKPFSASELVAKIRRMLEQPAAGRSAKISG